MPPTLQTVAGRARRILAAPPALVVVGSRHSPVVASAPNGAPKLLGRAERCGTVLTSLAVRGLHLGSQPALPCCNSRAARFADGAMVRQRSGDALEHPQI
jgi:hypothetical protein